MKNFLLELQEKIDLGYVSISDSPFKNVRSSDHVVGVCTQRVKVLYSILDDIEEKLEELKVSLEGVNMDSKNEQHVRWRGQLFLLRYKEGVLNNLIRVFIREDNPELYTKCFITVRRGWQIVYVDEEDILKDIAEPIAEILAMTAEDLAMPVTKFGLN